MDLALDDSQAALTAAFADLLAKHATTDAVRAAESTGFDPALWSELCEVGVVEMAVPESAGGWGATVLDLVLVAEQVGAAIAPAPVIEAQVAAGLLAALGSEPGGSAPADVLAGRRVATLAVRPATGRVAALVPAAAIADEALVLAGERLVIVPLDATNRRPVANLAAAPLADVTLDGAVALAEGPEAVAGFEHALDRWLVLTAGALVGLGAAAHRVTCAYARERTAWGVPIGVHQGVAHPLADGATAIDGARLLAYRAGWAMDHAEPRGPELAALAFGFAAETARRVTYDAVHFHGGVGFTLEADPQLYYRRARGWARVWGAPRDAYRRAARLRRGTQAA